MARSVAKSVPHHVADGETELEGGGVEQWTASVEQDRDGELWVKCPTGDEFFLTPDQAIAVRDCLSACLKEIDTQ